MASQKEEPSYSSTENLGYLSPPPIDLQWPKPEGFREKMWRKTGENPFVPIGLGVTAFALTYGLWQLKTGDKVMSQKMMRLRVAAQGFTVVALLGGVLYNTHKERAKKLQNMSQSQGDESR